VLIRGTRGGGRGGCSKLSEAVVTKEKDQTWPLGIKNIENPRKKGDGPSKVFGLGQKKRLRARNQLFKKKKTVRARKKKKEHAQAARGSFSKSSSYRRKSGGGGGARDLILRMLNKRHHETSFTKGAWEVEKGEKFTAQ